MQTLTTIKPRERDCVNLCQDLREDYAMAHTVKNFALAESLYLEIQKAKEQKLADLKRTEEARQTFEKECLDQAQALAISQEEKVWADNELVLQQEIEKSIRQLQEDQEVELSRFEIAIAEGRPKVRLSGEALALIKESETLFKLKEFEKARRTQELAERAKAKCSANAEEAYQRKVESDRQRLYEKHDREIMLLEQKNYVKFCEFWAARNKALGVVKQRGKNLAQDLDSAHRAEYINLRLRCVDRDAISHRKSYAAQSSTFRGSAFLKSMQRKIQAAGK